jgi:hypothetical protein
MGTQLALPAHWARYLPSYIDPVTGWRSVCSRLKPTSATSSTGLPKYGATTQDVAVPCLIDDTLGDLLYERRRLLEHEIEDGDPV